MSLTTAWVMLGLWSVALGHKVDMRYLAVQSSATISCECQDTTCQKVYWYRVRQSDGVYEHLLCYTSADAAHPSDTAMRGRLQGRKGSTKTQYTLTLSNLTREDAGWYSCAIPKQTYDDTYWLRVGEAPPTTPAPPQKTTKIPSRRPGPKLPSCCSVYQPPKGCGKWVLWPLCGGLILLTVLLVAVSFYFSRLPKKCRHQFVKTNQKR
ncbi:CMRF35-like molecule 8 [Engraulis encrasicolus]|uniref:CMRF35-like molecule 8 n=1 Tax=Engraulis encrasicolus TaxID=184585 RepID=UPI002FCF1EE7